jgi:hypothetical protein
MSYQQTLDFAYDEATIEEGIHRFYFTNGLGTDRVQWEVVEEHGPGGGWPVIRFTADEKDDMVELLQAYGGFSDEEIREMVEPWTAADCDHANQSSHEGKWTCDQCGAETTADALERLVETVREILERASQAESGTRAHAALIHEAAIWFRGVEASAENILIRTGFPGKPDRI